MSGGQDFNATEFVQAVDDVQARLAVGSERRRVVDGLNLNMKGDDFRVPPAKVADDVVRAFIVADYQGFSLAEMIVARIEGAR